MPINRRQFILAGGMGLAGVLENECLSVQAVSPKAPAKGIWSFIHFTDVHVQPELRAGEGYRQAVSVMNRIRPKPALAIAGGDLVFDVFETDFGRADLLFKMYTEITRGLDMPIYHTIGNHDLFGIDPKSGVSATHPEYGKKMFSLRVGEGKTYRSFDYRDWHFILLDSIFVKLPSDYEGRIDAEQLAWLQKDLSLAGPQRPIVLVTHIPFFSILPVLEAGQTQAASPELIIDNTQEVLKSCEGYNIKLILQGHLHIVEDHRYKNRKYITSGAVCGNWWRGLRMGHPEGFAVYTIHGDEVTWSYHTYGWKAEV